ncbi:Bax inhibitor-1 family protein [Opitutales bacterium]|nr:Bax inhibitor-1 family protein [Opitutales bacterium]
MNEVLFIKTFCLIGAMLIITSIGAKLNKVYETLAECVITVSGMLGFIILVHIHAHEYPMNLFCLGMVSLFVGWSLGPAITGLGNRFMFRKFLEKIGVETKLVEVKTKWSWLSKNEIKKAQYYYKDAPEKVFEENSLEVRELRRRFEEEVLEHERDQLANRWKNMVTLAIVSTALAVFLTASIVWFSNVDFGFLGGFLTVVLAMLALIKLKKSLTPNASIYSLPLIIIGIIHAMLLLIYDFNRLEKALAAGDESWSTAVKISLSIYLDIIWLFIQILELMGNEG